MNLNPQVARGLYDSLHVVAEGEKFHGELLYLFLLVQEADLVEQLSLIVEDGCLAHLLMHVYSHVLHWVSPLGGLRTACSYGVSWDHSCSRSGFGPVLKRVSLWTSGDVGLHHP